MTNKTMKIKPIKIRKNKFQYGKFIIDVKHLEGANVSHLWNWTATTSRYTFLIVSDYPSNTRKECIKDAVMELDKLMEPFDPNRKSMYTFV